MEPSNVEIKKIFMESEFILFDKIGDFKIENKKIKESFFYDNINFWNSLRISFRLYYLNLGKTRRKTYIYNIKKLMEKKLFTFKNKKIQTDMLFFNTTYGRYNKNDFSPFYKPVIKNLKNQIVEVSYINFPSFFNLNTYDSFDYKKRFPFQMFILEDNEEEKIYLKGMKLYSEVINSKKFITFLSKHGDVELILKTLKYVFCESFCESIRTYSGHKKMLEVFKPQLFIMCDFVTQYTYTAILAAKKNNIKTIIITHGIPGIYFNFPKDYVLPTKICTYGKKDYEMYMKGGVPKENLEITGDVRVNEIPSEEKITKNKYKKLLWLTSGISKERSEKIIKLLLNFAKINKLDLTIKMHPDDPFFLSYKKESILSNTNCKITKKSNLLKHIKESDFVICNESTALVDVMANYKPIIFENLEKKEKIVFDYFDKTTFHDNETLEKSFEYIRSKEAERYYKNIRKQILEDFSYDYGTAPEKIAKIIKNMIK
jgi:hypothetical protein